MWELWLALTVALIAAWTGGMYLLHRRGLLEPRGLAPAGPFLMWKTQRGRDLIDRLARRKRAWRIFGDLSLVLVALTMVGTTLLLIWEATIVQSPAVRANPPSPELLLGLPGINPLIPVGYGIFGLAVAIVLHEFAHGILARVANIPIKSLGVIFCIFPVGAFVEPEEEKMKTMPRRERARLYAVGPATNVLLALLFAFLFSSVMMASVRPVHAGVGIVGFPEGASPARDAGIPPYVIITSFDGTEIRTYADFLRAKGDTVANQTVNVTTFDGERYTNYTFALGWDSEGGPGAPYIGVFGMDTSTDFYHPLTNPDRFGGVVNSLLSYISLPFGGRAPIEDPAVRFYRIEGPMAAIPAPLFWLVANAMYWLFWLNLMLGATNALPAIPLDGGYIFKDALEGFVSKARAGLSAERRERIAKNVSYFFALMILSLVVWQIIGPRI